MLGVIVLSVVMMRVVAPANEPLPIALPIEIILFVDCTTGHCVSLFSFQFEQGILKGEVSLYH